MMIVKIQIAILMILLQMISGCGENVDVCNKLEKSSKIGGDIDLSGQDLSGRDFSSQDLEGANLTGANLGIPF